MGGGVRFAEGRRTGTRFQCDKYQRKEGAREKQGEDVTQHESLSCGRSPKASSAGLGRRKMQRENVDALHATGERYGAAMQSHDGLHDRQTESRALA
jgi:hypothetical protein